VQYAVEKKDLQIKNQESELEKEKATNRLLITGILFVCILVILLAYLAVRNARTKTLLFKKEKELDLHFSTVKLEDKAALSSFDFEATQGEGQLDHQRLFQDIIEFIRSKKLYLDPKFNQQSLVTLFGTNRQYLYEAISKNGDDNFRGIINRFRINEAKKLLAEQLDSELPLDVGAIAEKVGFNSYPTFYRAFKNITGLTPLDFTKELRKDRE
jgi:AraC-like DNA-binding protein